jgi:hypothetical protein
VRTALLVALLALPTVLYSAPQEFGSLDGPPAKSHQFVAYQSEQLVVPAGKRAVLELRFRVEDGYHVNSHTPKSDLQIPTRVELEGAAGVKLAAAEYPAGKSYSFSFDPKEKLDVYQDWFVVKVPVVASAGAHEVKGALKYQACDHAACYPPKTLPVTLMFTAK